MSTHVLAALGRTHDRENVARAVEAIRAAEMPSFNLDLIYGAVGETIDDWSATIEAALAFDPPHISAYGLTVEAGTPLASQPDRHPDDDDQADKYELVDDLLGAAGLDNYEVSNWARPGHESRHNHLYWDQADYRGFGCAAHSHESGRRWWNLRTPDRYVEAISRRETVEASSETLDAETRRFEGLQLALRTRDGVERSAFGEDTLELLEDMAYDIKKSSLCGLGQTAPNPVLSTIRYFRNEYETHIKEQECPSHSCKPLLHYRVIEEKCKKCGICPRVCPVDCIAWEKGEVAVIDREACTECTS